MTESNNDTGNLNETENQNEEIEQVEVPEAPVAMEKKGLMKRRESFAQDSVPNAHKGYSNKPPRVMIGIICVIVIISFILAGLTS